MVFVAYVCTQNSGPFVLKSHSFVLYSCSGVGEDALRFAFERSRVIEGASFFSDPRPLRSEEGDPNNLV